MIKLFIKLSVLLFIIFPILVNAQVRFVEVTGRSVIQDDSPILSKNTALEDALYLAALEGGAKVSGYSLIDSFSNLREEVIVQPASGILDYTIIDEMISDQHYEVTIRALIGKNNDRIGCKSRITSTLIAFQPEIYINQNSPAWSQYVPNQIYKNIIDNLSNFDEIEIINATDTKLNINNNKLKLNDFDYNVLTGNVVNYKPADLSLETKFLIEPVQNLYPTNLSTETLEEHLKITTEIIIKDISNNKEIFKTSKDALTFIGPRETIFKSINILSRPKRKKIINSLISAFDEIPLEINENLKCVSLITIAQPSNIENAINVNLGTNQGISLGNLALSESRDTPFSVFEVIDVSPNQSKLMPLNLSRNIENYYGKTITFMEF
jgi:hypothetical protein|tara:strand:+ start:3706 stop:4848 length:1143 start_codon:yes stop_codon:yes gene_type:complete